MGSHKILKRLTSLLCAVSLLLSMISIPTNAVTAYAVTATTNQTVRQGDTAYCYVYINSTEELAALDVTVHFDPAKVKVGDVYNSISCQVYDSAKKESRIQFSYILDGVGTATKTQLFYFSYQVLSDAELGSAHFNITIGEAYDAALNEVTVSGSRCGFTITEKNTAKTCSISSTSAVSTAVAEEFILNYSFSTKQIASGSAEIRYDPDLFEVVEADPGPFLDGKIADVNATLPGSIYLSFVGTEYGENRFVLSVKFRTLKNVDEHSNITFTVSELCDLQLNHITCADYVTRVTVQYDESYVGNAPTVAVSAAYDEATEQVTAVIRLPEKSRLGAGDFVLLFDPEMLKLVSYEKGFEPNFFAVNDKEAAKGILKFSVLSLKDIVSEETVMTLTFDAIRRCNEQVALLDFTGSMLTDSLTKPILLNFADGQASIPEKHVYSGVCDTNCDLCDKERQVDVAHTYDGITDNCCNVCQSIRAAQSIVVSTLPLKTEYLEAKDLLDITGGKITVTYEDGDTGIMDMTADMISGFSNAVPGQLTLTVNYGGVTDTFEVKILEKSLVSIEVSALPRNMEYLEGRDALDLYGGLLLLTYDNGTTKEISLYDAQVTGFDNTVPGEQTLTVSYGGKTTTFTVTIVAKTVTRIRVHEYPETSYLEGAEFDPTGLRLYVYYNNNTQEIVDAGYTVTGYDSTPGDKYLTISYGGKSTSLYVWVEAKSVDHIEVTKLPDKVVYIEGQTFDPSGMVVTVFYNNGTQEDTENYTYYCGELYPGEKSVEVYCEGSHTSFTIQIKEKTVTELVLISAPYKTTYIEGVALDPYGLSIQVLYDNGDVGYISTANITGYNENLIGVQTVTAEYSGKTVTFEVEVIPKTLQSISIREMPDKTEYLEGAAFDPTGMVVVAYYDNDTTEIVREYTVEGYDPLVIGSQELQVIYQGCSTSVRVYVHEKSLTSIVITTAPTKTEYLEGEDFECAGMVVTAYYDNGTQDEVTDYHISGYSSDPGDHIVTVYYNGFSDTVNVHVRPKSLTGIQITHMPEKLTYIEGVPLDLEGLELTAVYDNGTSHPVWDYTVTGSTDTVGTATITLIYQDYEVSFEVTVEQKSLYAISVSREPDKMNYVEDTEFDPVGMELALHYDNGTTEYVTEGWRLVYDFALPGSTVVEIYYQIGDTECYTCLWGVWIEERQLQELRILTPPDKVAYIEGQQLDLTGMTLEALYNNGQTETLEYSQVYAENFNPYAIETQTVHIYYRSVYAQIEVTVEEKSPVRIWIGNYPYKQLYIEGQELDLSGLEIWVDYNNDTQEVITDFTVEGYDTTPGQKILVFTYEGLTTSMNISVEAKSAVRIEVENFPDRMEYAEGETIDFTGLTVRAYYNNGTSELVTDYGIDNAALTPGYVTVYINYMGVSTSFMVYVVEENLEYIRIERLPDKLEYLEGDELDLTGMILMGYYNNGRTKQLTEYIVSGYSPYPGEKCVYITYGPFVDEFCVEVRSKTMIGIEITRLPDKLEYIEGQPLDLSGMEVSALFDNGTTEWVWDYEVSGSVDTVGTHTITVSYNGFEVSFEVIADTKSVSYVEITKRPDTMQYIVNTPFDPTGMELTVYYDNGSSEVMTEGWTMSYDFSYPGVHQVEISYFGHICYLCQVVVDNRQLQSLQIITPPDKLEYLEGDPLDLMGIIAEVLYDNGESETQDAGNLYAVGYDPNVPGTQRVTIRYGSLSAELEVTVIAKSPIQIWISRYPDKTYYVEGDELDLSGLRIWADYDNCTQGIITDFSVEGYDSTPGTKTLVFTYEGLTTSINVYVEKKYAEWIEVVTLPDRTEYLEGDTLDFTGLTVRAYYNNGKSELIEDYTIPEQEFAPGYCTVDIYYMDAYTNFEIFIEPKSLESISLESLPDKLEYLEGDSFDPRGLLVWAHYNNGTSEQIGEYTVYGYDSSPGTKVITVFYMNFKETFEVYVRPKSVVEINIVKLPDKMEYLEGKDLDLKGMVVEAVYDNGDKEVITDYEVSGYDPTPGEKTVIISCSGVSDSFSVFVREKTLKSISVYKMPDNTVYVEGRALDLTGLVILAHYDNDAIETVEGYTVSGYTGKPGTNTITITYGKCNTTFDVSVKHKKLTSITIKKAPDKTTYLEGENLDLAGLVIEGQYDNGTTEELKDYAVFGYDSAPGTKTITVSVGGQNAQFQVTVTEKSFVGITIDRLPEKLIYLEGENLEIDGLKVLAQFNNGTSQEIGGYEISAIDPYRPGEQTVTITYNGKTATFIITVNAKELVSITVKKNPDKQKYTQGESLDTTGMVIVGYYNNGTSAELTDYTVSGYDANTPGIQYLTVAYGKQTTTIAVEVEKKAPQTVTSDQYTVSNGQISKISTGTKASQLLGGLDDDQNVKVFSGDRELPADTVVGTGMTVKLMDGNNVVQTLTVVVTGDTNGDGKSTVTDMLAVKSHLLKKSNLSGAPAQAADTSKDGGISITDFIQIKAAILGKGTITPS